MVYYVKEIFLTIQGEGINCGRVAVFCRFSGCNLWSGREIDRPTAACKFCDTDFVGLDGDRGGRYLAEELANTMACLWPQETTRPLAVMTGGEPLLQLDSELIHALHARGFEIAVETNGTIPIPGGVDWVCVSPKSATMLSVVSGDELKIVYPQKNLPPEALENMEFNHKILQPMDGPEREKNLKAAIAYCLAHPRWRLSLQTHKIIGIR